MYMYVAHLKPWGFQLAITLAKLRKINDSAKLSNKKFCGILKIYCIGIWRILFFILILLSNSIIIKYL